MQKLVYDYRRRNVKSRSLAKHKKYWKKIQNHKNRKYMKKEESTYSKNRFNMLYWDYSNWF